MGRNFTQYTKRELNQRLKNKEFEPATFWNTWYNSGYSSYHQDRLADENRSDQVRLGLSKGCVFSKTSPNGNDVNQPQFHHLWRKKYLTGKYSGKKLKYWDTPWGLEDHRMYFDCDFKRLHKRLKNYVHNKSSNPHACMPIVIENLVYITSVEYFENVISNGIPCVPVKGSSNEVWIVTKAKHMPHMGTFGNGASDVKVFKCEGYRAIWSNCFNEYELHPALESGGAVSTWGRNLRTFWVSRIGDEPIPLATYSSEQDEKFDHKTVVAPCLRRGAKAIADAMSTLRD